MDELIKETIVLYKSVIIQKTKRIAELMKTPGNEKLIEGNKVVIKVFGESVLTLTNTLLKEAHEYCDINDKSTEFMLEYMQDYASVNLDTVLEYLKSNS